MRRHLKTVNGALNTDDPAAESLNNKKSVCRVICVQSASPRQAINMLKHSKKTKNKIHSHES